MRILLVGAGGVGDAIAKIAAERDFYELFVISDYDQNRAERTLDWIANRHGDEVASKFLAVKIDASNAAGVAATAKEHGITHILNAVELGVLDDEWREADQAHGR